MSTDIQSEGDSEAAFVDFEIERLPIGRKLGSDVFGEDSILLKKGVVITEKFINVLKRRGVSVVRVTSEAAAEITVQESKMAEAAFPPTEEDERLAKEIHESEGELWSDAGVEPMVDEQLLLEASECIEDVFERLSAGAPANLDVIKEPVKEIVRQAIANPSAAVKLLDVESYDQYTFRHSVNVGLIFLALAKDIYPPERHEELTIGAMLHDIGKTKIPKTILLKPGRLTAEEFDLMKKHPEFGVEILEEADGYSEDCIIICRSHHERMDGSGYPDGLEGDEIPEVARLAAVCDVYDALTTTRSYKGKMDFHKAMRIIVQGAGSQFSKECVRVLSVTVGIYPIGTFVQLSNSEIAVVREVNPGAMARPTVMVLYDATLSRLPDPRRINLALDEEISITKALWLRREVRA